MCSELTPRAHIPDTRIPQLMQPWQYEQCKLSFSRSLWGVLLHLCWSFFHPRIHIICWRNLILKESTANFLPPARVGMYGPIWRCQYHTLASHQNKHSNCEDSIHLIEYFMPGLSSELHINIVWINFVHLVFTIYLSRYHPTPTPNFCVCKKQMGKNGSSVHFHQTQVRSLSTLVSNSLTYQTKPTKPSSWSQTYQTKFTPKT